MSESKAPAPIGSRPAVGSSRNRISGSNAMARARPARLRIPPDSSEGCLSPASGARPTMSILMAAISSISAGASVVCSLSGRATFCITVSEENKAPSWNSTPQRRSIRVRSSSSSSAMFSPNTSMVPETGGLRPTMVRISTDLPVPEPPTTANTSPRWTSRSRWSWITCLPNWVRRPRTRTMGVSSSTA